MKAQAESLEAEEEASDSAEMQAQTGSLEAKGEASTEMQAQTGIESGGKGRGTTGGNNGE